jgi:hypothetical protein
VFVKRVFYLDEFLTWIQTENITLYQFSLRNPPPIPNLSNTTFPKSDHMGAFLFISMHEKGEPQVIGSLRMMTVNNEL